MKRVAAAMKRPSPAMKRVAAAMKRPSACEGDLHPFELVAMKRPARGGDLNTSGATQPAEVQQLVAEVRELGHFPLQSDPVEKNLYRRLYYRRALFSEEQWQDLKNTGASQPAEVEQFDEVVTDLGHAPMTQAEVTLLMQAIRTDPGCLFRSRQVASFDPELDELISQQQPPVKKLLEEVLHFGRLPHQIKKHTNAPESREHRLAHNIDKTKKEIPHELWERIAKHCAKAVTVNGSDEAEWVFACERILKQDTHKIFSLSVNDDTTDPRQINDRFTNASAKIAAKLKILAHACPNLLQFRVENGIFAEGVLSAALPAIAQACPLLMHLQLGGNNISDSAVQVVSQTCPELRLIDLSRSGISDVAVQAVARGCARLEELNVMDCVNLTDVAFLALAQGCPQLRSLTIWKSIYEAETEVTTQRPKVTDVAISAIAQQCPNLERLELCGLESLTDASMHAVAHGCRSLRDLDGSLCCRLTDATIQSLVHHCSTLSILKLRYCPRITTSGVSALAQGSFALRYLDVRPLRLSIDLLRECEVAGRGL
jgi:hypothetical protein